MRVIAAIPVLFAALLSSAPPPASSVQQQGAVGQKRKIMGAGNYLGIVKNTPVGDLEADDWIDHLEIEVENISDKPIYYISLDLIFPQVKMHDPVRGLDAVYMIGMSYGDHRLYDLEQLPGPNDKPIGPGQRHTLKVSDGMRRGFESALNKAGQSKGAIKDIKILIQRISHGDGTGAESGYRKPR